MPTDWSVKVPSSVKGTGVIAPTGKAVKVPCRDVFRVRDGKIASFNCYPSGTVLFGQLGVLTNLEAVLDQ
ncbi:nuclear transport factor 2 family protein [Streptomyces olivaceoviridis]